MAQLRLADGPTADLASVVEILLVAGSMATYDEVVRTHIRPSAGCSLKGSSPTSMVAWTWPLIGSSRTTRLASRSLTQIEPNPLLICCGSISRGAVRLAFLTRTG